MNLSEAAIAFPFQIEAAYDLFRQPKNHNRESEIVDRLRQAIVTYKRTHGKNTDLYTIGVTLNFNEAARLHLVWFFNLRKKKWQLLHDIDGGEHMERWLTDCVELRSPQMAQCFDELANLPLRKISTGRNRVTWIHKNLLQKKLQPLFGSSFSVEDLDPIKGQTMAILGSEVDEDAESPDVTSNSVEQGESPVEIDCDSSENDGNPACQLERSTHHKAILRHLMKNFVSRASRIFHS